uniref:WPP domain-containing protein n=1 Tax=Oryza meridionalis TaxID=40149 RepID=A0A0E0FEG1_9ORYZ
MEAAESLEYELQKEVSNIMIQNYITSVRREFETKLWENQNCISTLNKNWKENVSKIAALRDELSTIYSVVSASESGVLSSHGSHEKVEELNFLKMKDDNESSITERTTDSGELMLDIPDFSLLKHMPKSKSESNSMKSSLYEALQQINVCKQEIHGLTDNLTSMSIALEEAKEQNASLDATIQEMKKTSAPSINSHKGQAGHLEYVLVSMEKLSKSYSDFESRLAQSMKRNEIRLTNIICQFNPLVQQVAVLKKKEFWYKQILEIKCSNLQKAEAEVDILGDEVDALLSILGKIYIALDHYSPVLKHYPGVTEILNLVQKALKGESI